MVMGTTTLVGIIGSPVSHSLSPAMHNAAFRSLGLDWVYVPLPVKPHRLWAALEGLSALGFAGANVTVPHKESVMDFLDQVSRNAEDIGAVNTITLRDGHLIGDNTDWSGFLKDIEELGAHPDGASALILGSGGSGRAVAYALAGAGAAVTICSRNPGKGEALAADLSEMFPGNQVQFLPDEHVCRAGEIVDLIVNTTPVGMTPLVDASPWPDGAPFHRCKLVYDLVYNPPQTKFVMQAAAQGIRYANGLGMLVYQAAESFRIWTGLDAPVEVMRRAAERALTQAGSDAGPNDL
jgi:shikimate dehydrogenase